MCAKRSVGARALPGRAALACAILASPGCVGLRAPPASEQALRSLIQVVEGQSPSESTVIAVCSNGRRVSGSSLGELQATSAATLVNCDRRFESRDGRYVDRSTHQQLWAVNLEELRLGGDSGSAEGSVHCGFTCGGEHVMTLVEKDGEWSVVQRLPSTVF